MEEHRGLHHAAHANHGSIHLVGERLPKFSVERLTGPGAEPNAHAEVASKAIGVVTRVEEWAAEGTGEGVDREAGQGIGRNLSGRAAVAER